MAGGYFVFYGTLVNVGVIRYLYTNETLFIDNLCMAIAFVKPGSHLS